MAPQCTLGAGVSAATVVAIPSSASAIHTLHQPHSISRTRRNRLTDSLLFHRYDRRHNATYLNTPKSQHHSVLLINHISLFPMGKTSLESEAAPLSLFLKS